MQTAKELMTRNPEYCYEDDTVSDAVRVMQKFNCGVVPVSDEHHRCVGIVTDRDICMKVVNQDLDPQTTRLRDIMTTDVVTCHENEDMDSVLQRMEQRQVKRIPVVDELERCIGIISEKDVAQKEENRTKVVELIENVYK